MAAGRYLTSTHRIAMPGRRWWHLVLIAVVLSCLGCSGRSAAPQARLTLSETQNLVNGELAAYFPDLKSAPPPGPFQQELLDKSELTFADYQSAMQAAADCIEQKDPGASVTLQLQPGWQQVFYFVVSGGGGAVGSLDQGTSPDRGTSSSEAGGAQPPSSTITPPDAGTTATTEPTTQLTLPAGVIGSRAIQGYCIATYSARVEARWRVMQALTGPQISAQRVPFLQCMAAAGITVAADTSNEQLGRIFSDPSTYAKLDPQQMQASNACTTRFQQFLFSIAPP